MDRIETKILGDESSSSVARDEPRFEFVWENEEDSTTRVLTPRENQTLEELLEDLQIFSGNLRVRRVTPQAPSASAPSATSTSRQIPLVEESGGTGRIEEFESTGSLPIFSDVSTPAFPNRPYASEEFRVPTTYPRGTDQQQEYEDGVPPRMDRTNKAVPHRRRTVIKKRTSMRELAQLDSFSDSQGQTRLHYICAAKSIDFRRVGDLVERYPNMVKQQDSHGRLPLHVLSNNSELIDSSDGRKAATKCALFLMDVYPEGIVTLDSDGRMPFTYLILKWVEWAFDSREQAEQRNSGESSQSRSVSAVIAKINRKLQSMNGVKEEKSPDATTSMMSFSERVSSVNLNASQGSSIVANLRDSMSKSSNRFPPVLVFDEVEWCFEMLSFGMDHLGGKPLDPNKKIRPTLAYTRQREQRKALAQNIAAIPGLLRTVLLIESKETRSFIVECSAMRRAFFCPEIIGPWLTSMMRYTKGTSLDVALDFLKALSRLKVEDHVGGYRKAQPADEKEFHSAKRKIFKAVDNLGDVIPTLLIAGEDATNKAVATPLVCFIMNRQMMTPFTVGTGIGEFLLHLCLILVFRQVVLEDIPDEEFFIHFPWMRLQSVIFWIATHELVFKVCEFVSLSRISKRNAMRVAFGWWPLIEISGTVLALWAAVRLDKGGAEETEFPFVYAFILGLLWVRMLGFLKVVNEDLATFILALTRMLYDIRFFVVVLCIFVITVGDMFQLVVRYDDDLDCSADDNDPAVEEFCSPRSFDAYLRTYAIVVGDFELEQYNRLKGVTFLWFVTTFFGTIILLNVLIALVTLSYSNSQESSVILFRRARAQFLGSHAVMEKFIRPSQSKWSEKMSTASFTYISLIFLRWILIITWLTGSLWSFLYIFEEVAYTFRADQPLMAIPFILLTIGMSMQLLTAVNFSAAVLVEQVVPSEKFRGILLEYIERSTEYVLRRMISRMYGMDRKDTESGEVALGPNREVLARLDRLENLIQKVLTKQKREDQEELGANFEDVPHITLQTLHETEVADQGYTSSH